MNMVSDLARLYFSHLPLGKGKATVDVFQKQNRVTSIGLQNFDQVWLEDAARTREKIDQFIYYWGFWEPNETWAMQQFQLFRNFRP